MFAAGIKGRLLLGFFAGNVIPILGLIPFSFIGVDAVSVALSVDLFGVVSVVDTFVVVVVDAVVVVGCFAWFSFESHTGISIVLLASKHLILTLFCKIFTIRIF